jgi:hypothetical protein
LDLSGVLFGPAFAGRYCRANLYDQSPLGDGKFNVKEKLQWLQQRHYLRHKMRLLPTRLQIHPNMLHFHPTMLHFQ